MTPERLHKLRGLLDEALSAPEGERARVLARVMAEDSGLGAELARLITRAEVDDGRFEPLMARVHARFPELCAEGRLGAWRLVRPLGRGGMGDVWLAERADGAYTQQVAVKSPRSGLETAAALSRFERERSLLAALEHPSIARLVDGGTTAEGRPWLAMEYVEGQPLDEYARARGLTLHARVALARDVARALGAAHQRLVVHRDLKPSNVLVRADGRVALVDFGIGALLGDAGTALGSGGSYLGTPRYASPEQQRGEPCTTASDVYSLALLVRELCGSVDQDLAAVLAYALLEDPAARIASAESFADELERWLARRPVESRHAGARHRVRLFVRRNPPAAAALTGVAIAVLGGLTATTLLWRAERAERVRARAAEARATERLGDVRALVGALVGGVHDRVGALVGAVPVRAYLVEMAERHLAALEAEHTGDEGLARDIVEVHLRLADVRGARTLGNTGELAAAATSAARALELAAPRARAERARTGEAPRATAWTELELRARRLAADLARARGELQDAAAAYDAVARDAAHALTFAAAEEAPALERTRAAALLQRARVDFALLPGTKALERFEVACAAFDGLYTRAAQGPDGAARDAGRNLALARAEHGRALAQLGRQKEALDAWRGATEVLRALDRDYAADAQLARDRVELEAELATTLAELGEADAAAATIDGALAAARELVKRDAGNVLAERALHLVCIRAARVATLAGETALALSRYDEAAQLVRMHLERARSAGSTVDHDVERDLAECLAMGAEVARRDGVLEDVEARFREAEALLPTGAGAVASGDHLAGNVLSVIAVGRGQLALQRGAPAEAAALLEARRAEAEAWSASHSALHWPLRHAGALEYALGTAYEALAAESAAEGARAERLTAARGAFARGLAAAHQLAAEGRLAPHEAPIVGYFEADVARVDAALASDCVD